MPSAGMEGALPWVAERGRAAAAAADRGRGPALAVCLTAVAAAWLDAPRRVPARDPRGVLEAAPRHGWRRRRREADAGPCSVAGGRIDGDGC